jgi:opacity protein-like surface antigen
LIVNKNIFIGELKMQKISKIIFSSAVMCFAFNAVAHAENYNNYMRLDLGAAFLSDVKNDRLWADVKKDKDAFQYGLNYGYQLHENFRGELAISRMDGMKVKGGNSSSQKFDTATLMAKGYLDWPVYDATKLYLSAGTGVAFNKAGKLHVANEIANDEGISEEFVWSVGVGGNYMLSDCLSADLQYNFYDLGKVKTPSVYANGVIRQAPVFKARAHSVTVGLSYHY